MNQIVIKSASEFVVPIGIVTMKSSKMDPDLIKMLEDWSNLIKNIPILADLIEIGKKDWKIDYFQTF